MNAIKTQQGCGGGWGYHIMITFHVGGDSLLVCGMLADLVTEVEGNFNSI